MDAIIRSGLSRFTDEVGRLWCKLADYYIRLGQFERARDVYEEAINSVVSYITVGSARFWGRVGGVGCRLSEAGP